MKRYDSITAIKAIACILVFTTHWKGAFGGFGIGLVDRYLEHGLMRLLGYGIMCVYVFFMLSGALISIRVFRGRPYSWAQETVRRYLRLTVPIFGVSFLVILFDRLGLLFNQAAAPYAPTSFLGTHYTKPIPLYKMITAPFVTTVFQGDASVYGPLWMIPYIFGGTFFSIILSEVILEFIPRWRVILYVLLGIIFLITGGHYFSFYLGNLLAAGILYAEACRERVQPRLWQRLCVGMLLLTVGLGFALEAFILAGMATDHNWFIRFGDENFWLNIGGFLASGGFMLLWETLFAGRKFWLTRLILWIGERSYSVFMTHWLVICSFSSWFYLRFYSAGPKLSIALNFILSTALILLASHCFYELFEKRIYQFLWKHAKKMIADRGQMSAAESTGKPERQ